MSDRHVPFEGGFAPEFCALVRRMRAAQKAYFKFQNRSDLIEAKKLEAQVDRWLQAEQPPWEPPADEEQPSLFDEP